MRRTEGVGRDGCYGWNFASDLIVVSIELADMGKVDNV